MPSATVLMSLLCLIASAEFKFEDSLVPTILQGLASDSTLPKSSDKSRLLHTEVEPSPMQLTLFPNDKVESFGARCLDGSPAGYYYREGMERDKFVIYLEGGGLCITPIDCHHRAKTHLGSSKHWPSNYTDTKNVLSRDASNPFRNWSHVYVPYGSGDVFIGTQREKNEMGLYMAGHLTMEAIISDLVNKTTFGKAHSVLLTGASAGGIGTFQNADWLGGRLHALSPGVKYKASPQAGAFFVNSKLEMMAQYVFGYRFGLNAAFLFADYVFAFIRGTGRPPQSEVFNLILTLALTLTLTLTPRESCQRALPGSILYGGTSEGEASVLECRYTLQIHQNTPLHRTKSI